MTLYDSLLPNQQRDIIEKYRYVEVDDYDRLWAENTLDDIKRAGKLLGIVMHDFSWDVDPANHGFRFKGMHTYHHLAHLLVFHDYPKDEALQAIAAHLHYAQPLPYTIKSYTRFNGRYNYSKSMYVDCELRCPYPDDDTEAEDYPADFIQREARVTEALRDFCRWAIKQLQDEHDYYTSDQGVINYINNQLTLEDIEELQEAA